MVTIFKISVGVFLGNMATAIVIAGILPFITVERRLVSKLW